MQCVAQVVWVLHNQYLVIVPAVCVIPRSPSSVPLVFLPLYFQLHIPRSLYYDPLFFVFLWLILYWLFPNPLFPSKPTRLWPTDPSVLTEVVPQVQVWYSHPQPPDPSPHPTPYFRIIFDTGSFAEPLCPTIPPPNVFFLSIFAGTWNMNLKFLSLYKSHLLW